ncbi:hypothetical protein BH11BAC7_BH11BAC7_32500 [soil metagenome]
MSVNKFTKIALALKLHFLFLFTQYIQGENRNQMNFSTLEDSINVDNPVRVIETFVNALDMKRIGIKENNLKTEGRPPFHAALFLKLYMYGYYFFTESTLFNAICYIEKNEVKLAA